MKKTVALFLTSIMICLLLFGCKNDITETPSNVSVESEQESVNESSGDISTESVDESVDESVGESVDDNSQEEVGGSENVIYRSFAGENIIYVTEDENFKQTLKIEYKNGETDEIYSGYSIFCIKVSPNGKKILFSNYEWEVTATVYLYDTDARKTETVEFKYLKENHTVHYLDWLDDRYFLFNTMLDHGTVAQGGNVYSYDTERKFNNPVITTESDALQIRSFEKIGDDYILNAINYDEGFAEFDELYFVIPIAEIEKHSKLLAAITLRAKNGIKTDEYKATDELPSLASRVNEGYIRSVAGGRDFDYNTLINMNSDEIYNEVFAPAMRLIGNFEGIGFISFSGGEVDFHYTDRDGKTQINTYYICNDDEIPDYKTFVENTRKYFSENKSVKLFSWGNFFEHEGLFLSLDGARGTHINYVSTEFSIKTHNENEIVYIGRSRYLKDEYHSDYPYGEQDNIPDEHCYFEELTYRLIKEDGKWVFDQFELPY